MMEGNHHHHGVDISWLHHSHSKDHHGSKDVATPPPPPLAPEKHVNGTGNEHLHPLTKTTSKTSVTSLPELKTNDSIPLQEQSNGPKPIQKSNSDLAKKGGKESRSSSPGMGLGRRGSWVTNITSKFSSADKNSPTPPPAQTKSAVPETGKENGTTVTSNGSPVPRDARSPEAATPPQASPSKSPGFLTSAFRRLSSSTGSGGSKVQGSAGVCPRKVMNVDPYRERCQIDDLTPSKLRRVSFCVDVEIAVPARYSEEEEPEPSPPTRRPSLTQLEKVADAKKAKEKNVKMKEQAEGEALKRPDAIAEEKEEQNGSIASVDEHVEPTPNPASEKAEAHENGEVKDGSRKKEKKKRSEEERKERKERKRLQAIANGQIPIEITQEDDASSDCATPTMEGMKTRSQSHPTIDPLRIYRRCCQLRESPILKAITDQLGNPAVCEADGTVTALDLTGLHMPLSDIYTFGDYLAVVPVRKLIMEDCDLADEGVRVILAGLLSAKTAEQAKFNRQLAKRNDETTMARSERLGIIEKLSLKNNPKIGRDGWTHIALFIHMSHSLKAIDLSMIQLPLGPESPASSFHEYHTPQKQSPKKGLTNVCHVLTKCFTSRLSSNRLEEVVMAECGLSTEQVEKIVSAVAACGVSRLGLANNQLSAEALHSVATYVATGQCEGLDLGGNDLSENLSTLTEALSYRENSLYALSLADCNLSPASLRVLFPALIGLQNFKFIDLSHNRKLFASQPNALYSLRKYLPQMHALKRIHLNDVEMDSEHCIALAEILPEIPYLAHLGILDNPKLIPLASAKDEATAEEACAFYASLMAAVRVSKSIVSLDIDMPTSESSDLVQALGKQIIAYALRNMERGPTAALGVDGRQQSLVEVPDILMHLVGHVDDYPENHDNDAPAPNEDYIVSGTGVAKALGICLGNTSADRRPSRDVTPMGRGTGSGRNSGANTPKKVQSDVQKFKARDMSKNLLDSARKIRARLQPALAKEEKSGDEMSYRKLQFLDSTLSRMIERFEDEFPECRPPRPASPTTLSSSTGSLTSSTQFRHPFAPDSQISVDPADEDLDDDDILSPTGPRLGRLSRHGSDVSLASRTLNNEEGQMHRFGQQIRREILAPQTFDHVHKSTGEEPVHLKALREKLEGLSGDEIKQKVREKGVGEVLREMGSSAEELRQLEQTDPESFEKFRAAQQHAAESVEVSQAG